VFLDQPWFYRSTKALTRKPLAAFGAFDAILLTQHLPDHAHPPTLRLLPRGLPVVAPTCAQELLRSLGYENVTTLSPHESATPLPTLLPGFTVTAGPGAIVGPPWSKPQLAYVFEFAHRTQPAPDGGAAASDATAVRSSSLPWTHPPLRIYFETHGMHDAGFLRKITDGGRIALDAVIGPVRGTTLPLPFAKGYTIVNGAAELLEACRVTRPKACVPFDNTRTAGSGLLSNFIDQSAGGYEELAAAVRADPQLRDMKICVPKLMEPLVIAPSSAVQPPPLEANEVASRSSVELG
jgi:L-ascorbate metabolism protein UlaG (beta-lactamase superfamily)